MHNVKRNLTVTRLESRTVVIEPGRGWIELGLTELWQSRELLYFLVWRDVKVRYKQTLLGASWAVLQPLLTMVVFSLFFGRLAGMPSDGVPYPLWSFAALVPWALFSTALSQSANSLVGSQNLIKKVYFPRLAIPLAPTFAALVDFAIALGVLFGMMAWFGVLPGAQALWLLPLTMLALVTSLGAGLWLSAINVEFRDVKHTLPFLLQLWLFATPIAYPSSLLDQKWRTVYALNPMAGVVEGFRWALLGAETRPSSMILASAAASSVLLVTGLVYFRRMERSFADVV